MTGIIKICGMREPENIREVAQTGVTWMGMIFWGGSSRYVADLSAADAIPEGITRVGVFVDQPQEEVAGIARRCELGVVQLHGGETSAYITALRKQLPEGCRIIKAISIGCEVDITKADEYLDCADLLLFDTKCTSVGGSGRQFDWDMLHRYDGSLPFLLGGGIGKEDASRIAAFSHPCMTGIDLNSRFETAPAVKDAAEIASFINIINK